MIASFVICFHTARIDNLLQTLRFLIANDREVFENSYLRISCQDNCDSLPAEKLEELEFLREQSHRSAIANFNLPCMQLPYLTNVSVLDAETDKVILLESDRILPPGYFSSILEDLKEGVQITCKNMKKLTSPTSDEQILSGIFDYKDEHRDETNRIGLRNMWSGNTAFWKGDYYKAGQMDESYLGYGWADSDMTNRMAKAGVASVWRPETELHLWHPSATYGEGDQKKMFIDNGLRFCKNWGIALPDWFKEEIAKQKKVML
jgi:hypothetical protein